MRAGLRAGAICMLLALAVLAGGCGWGETYEDEAQGYTIKLPRGWTIKQDAQGLVTAFAPRENPDQFQTFISVRVDGVGKDMPAKLYRDREMYNESWILTEQGKAIPRGGFNKVIEQGETSLAGHDAAWSLYSRNIGQVEVYAKSWFVTDATGRGFRVTATTSADQFEAMRPLFDKVADTLEILPPPEKL